MVRPRFEIAVEKIGFEACEGRCMVSIRARVDDAAMARAMGHHYNQPVDIVITGVPHVDVVTILPIYSEHYGIDNGQQMWRLRGWYESNKATAAV